MSIDLESGNMLAQRESPSLVGRFAKGTFRIGQSLVLFTAGVGCVVAGTTGAYLTALKLQDFYYSEDEQGKGYGDVPGFTTLCEKATNFSHIKLGYPEQDSKFCESMAKKPFSEQEGMFGPAALAASLGGSSLVLISSLYTGLAGCALMGKSWSVFVDTIF